MFPECLRVVTMFEAEFLEDLFNPNIDTTSSEYITDCEAKWSPELKGIRATPQGVIPTQKRAWAELRYNWLVNTKVSSIKHKLTHSILTCCCMFAC